MFNIFSSFSICALYDPLRMAYPFIWFSKNSASDDSLNLSWLYISTLEFFVSTDAVLFRFVNTAYALNVLGKCFDFSWVSQHFCIVLYSNCWLERMESIVSRDWEHGFHISGLFQWHSKFILVPLHDYSIEVSSWLGLFVSSFPVLLVPVLGTDEPYPSIRWVERIGYR